jgi:hypothetical protein
LNSLFALQIIIIVSCFLINHRYKKSCRLIFFLFWFSGFIFVLLPNHLSNLWCNSVSSEVVYKLLIFLLFILVWIDVMISEITCFTSLRRRNSLTIIMRFKWHFMIHLLLTSSVITYLHFIMLRWFFWKRNYKAL